MSTNITSAAGVGDHSQGSPRRDPDDRRHPVFTAPSDAPEPDPADFRLIIEGGETAGTFIYKTIDARTGAVIREIPREALAELSDQADYHAGDVIRASA